MTKLERQHLSKVAELGCIICRMPAEIHHIRNGVGMAQRSSHFNAIPLCPLHHRIGGNGVAIHAGQKTFESKFGTELELLDKVKRLINVRT
ncbi:MAG: Ref family recombination enhancement nuclease [Paludibacter sp.]|nr:Ref family recombination enhancement nuclease [Paludibacter sp.]